MDSAQLHRASETQRIRKEVNGHSTCFASMKSGAMISSAMYRLARDGMSVILAPRVQTQEDPWSFLPSESSQNGSRRDHISKSTEIETNRRYKALAFSLHMPMHGLHFTHTCVHTYTQLHMPTHTNMYINTF